jgi:hypothetical protein
MPGTLCDICGLLPLVFYLPQNIVEGMNLFRIMLTVAVLASTTAIAPAHADTPPKKHQWKAHRVHLELALFPMMTVQQIEGPARDDLITRESGLASQLSATVAVLKFLEVGVQLQLDAGGTRRALYERPGADGSAPVAQLVEGNFWEFWTMLLIRGRYGPAFAELGWAPLILRQDSARSDLANTAGANEGVLIGSRSVAWMLGLGGRIKLVRRIHLTLRLQFRIRYLIARGGEPLADDEETGQMTLWPFIGVSFAL